MSFNTRIALTGMHGRHAALRGVAGRLSVVTGVLWWYAANHASEFATNSSFPALVAGGIVYLTLGRSLFRAAYSAEIRAAVDHLVPWDRAPTFLALLTVAAFLNVGYPGMPRVVTTAAALGVLVIGLVLMTSGFWGSAVAPVSGLWRRMVQRARKVVGSRSSQYVLVILFMVTGPMLLLFYAAPLEAFHAAPETLKTVAATSAFGLGFTFSLITLEALIHFFRARPAWPEPAD